MKTSFSIIVFSLVVLITQCALSDKSDSIEEDNSCSCDTLKALATINEISFNRINKYDRKEFPADSLYLLSKEQNKELWYRDIQNPHATKFTKLWNGYVRTNYHASHKEFVEYFNKKENIELAFQFGPNMDLWAYHTFVARKLNRCYLVTHSYFRHARFTYKSYSIVNKDKLDSLFSVINKLQPSKTDTNESWNYSGHFVDNRDNKTFFVDFTKMKKPETDEPTKEVKALYDFVDKKINWNKTY